MQGLLDIRETSFAPRAAARQARSQAWSAQSGLAVSKELGAAWRLSPALRLRARQELQAWAQSNPGIAEGPPRLSGHGRRQPHTACVEVRRSGWRVARKA